MLYDLRRMLCPKLQAKKAAPEVLYAHVVSAASEDMSWIHFYRSAAELERESFMHGEKKVVAVYRLDHFITVDSVVTTEVIP